MGHTIRSYRCARDTQLLKMLTCDRDEANRRVNAAIVQFLSTQRAVALDMPITYDNTYPIGTGAIMDFFRALVAQWHVERGDIPFPVRKEVEELARGARADSYFRMLENCWRLVIALCADWDESTLPMTPGCAMGVIAKMARSDYSLGYIRNVRTTIRFAHHYAGLPTPTEDERFGGFYDCVARELGDAHPNAKLALSLDLLRAIGKRIYAGASTHEIQDWAILTLTYFSVFRRMNVCDLPFGDVEPFAGGLRLWLGRSKPDQLGHGHEVFIDPLPEEPELCPVRAILRWREQLDADPALPFFRHLGPLGIPTQKPLADRTITRILKDYLREIGVDPAQYAATSLRAGFITEAILRNVSPVVIGRHSNHRTLESLYRYFRPAFEQRLQLVRVLATTPIASPVHLVVAHA